MYSIRMLRYIILMSIFRRTLVVLPFYIMLFLLLRVTCVDLFPWIHVHADQPTSIQRQYTRVPPCLRASAKPD
jgi:hypothetical protein